MVVQHHAAAVHHQHSHHELAEEKVVHDSTLEAELHRILDEEEDEEVRRVLEHTVATDVRDPNKAEVNREKLMLFLEQERTRHDDCLQLPCTIAFFVIFVCTMLMHEDLSNSAQVERNYRSMIEGTTFEGLGPPVSLLKTSGHKDMFDIDTAGDIWTYLNEALVPLFIPGDPNALRRRSDIYRVLRYSHLIGGVQLQQIRRTRRECTSVYPKLGPKLPDSNFNPVLADVYCYPYDSYDDQCFSLGAGEEGFCPDTQVLGLPRRLEAAVATGSTLVGSVATLAAAAGSNLASAAPRLLRGLERHSSKVQGRSWEALSGSRSFEGGLYTVVLHPHQGMAAATQKLTKLQDNSWLDEGTAWFGVKMFLLHPDLSVYLHVIISIWFTPSGQLVPGLRLTSFPAEPYQYTSRMALDVIWLVLWLYLLVHNFTKFLKASFLRRAESYLKSFWTWVEWGTVVGGLVVIACWPVFLVMLKALKTKALELAQERPIAESNFQFDDRAHQERYLQKTLLMHTEAAGFASFVTFYRVFACNYTIMIIVRFFKAFQAQPRLAIVSNTIASSLSDIGHFLVVLTLVIISFAAAGMFLFGHRLLTFSSFGFACSECFLIMMGSFDYDELREEHPIMAALWFWSYFLFVSLILLNMALAIVMDVYAEVSANAADSNSIHVQFSKFVTRVWNRRDWVSWSRVMSKVRALETEVVTLNIASLCEACPEMPPEQAVEIIEGGEGMEAAEHERGLNMTDALRMVSWTKDAIEKMGHQLEMVLATFFNQQEKAEEAREARLARERQLAGLPATQLGFSPETEDKLSELEERFQKMETTAGEAVHSAVATSRQMRSLLASLEGEICGRGADLRWRGSPRRSPAGSPPSRWVSEGSSRFDF